MLLLRKILRLLLIALMCVSSFAVGQEQFAGKWQARKCPLTHKHCITMSIAVSAGKVSGNVVLVSTPDGSEIQSEMSNVDLHGDTLEFDTTDVNLGALGVSAVKTQ